MNKKLLIITGAAITSVGIYSASTFAANVANSTASANVVAPIDITEVDALDFGDIASDGTVGTVTYELGGTRTVTGGASLSTLPGNLGSYTVSGDGNRNYSILIPDTVLGGAGTNMPVTFTNDAGATPALSTGSDAFVVGGTLSMNATQLPGLYTGAYTVTVNYN